jgi:hypothetical protein
VPSSSNQEPGKSFMRSGAVLACAAVAGVVAVGDGDVSVAVGAQEADGQAAQGCRDTVRVAGSDQGLIFLVGDVASQWSLFSISRRYWLRAAGMGKDVIGGRESLVAVGGERENFHRSARAPPATRRHAGRVTHC